MSYTSSRCRRPVCCASTASFLQDSASPCGPAAGAEGAAWQDVRRGAAADDLVRHRRRCLVCSTAFVAKTAPFLAVIRCVVIGIKLGGGDQSIVISPDDGHVLQASDRFIIITGELVNWSLAPFLVCSTAFHCLSLCVPLPSTAFPCVFHCLYLVTAPNRQCQVRDPARPADISPQRAG